MKKFAREVEHRRHADCPERIAGKRRSALGECAIRVASAIDLLRLLDDGEWMRLKSLRGEVRASVC